MKIKKLGENLYRVEVPIFAWSPVKTLTEAILKLQGEGKKVTAIHYSFNFIRSSSYLICTSD